MNLVLCLLSTRQYLTAERIRRIVPGYAGAPTDEAFYRTFERDKSELRDLGVPLEIGRNSAFDSIDGYRIARRDYELGDIGLEPDEAAAVALALRLWDSPEMTGAARGALLKLRAAGVDVDDRDAGAIEPKVRTSEPAFPALLAAVRSGRSVEFDYRRPNDPRAHARSVEPWGVVSWRGRWYLVGFDLDRQAPRCFRLSRIFGQPKASGPAGAVSRPEDVDLMELVAGEQRDSAPVAQAKVWVRRGRAQGLRRLAAVVGERRIGDLDGDVVEVDLFHPDSAASWLAGYGPDVLVLEPEVLCKAVHELHLGAAAAAGGAGR